MTDPQPPDQAGPSERPRRSWARPTPGKALVLVVALVLVEVGIAIVRPPGDGGILSPAPGGSAASYRFDYLDPLTGDAVGFNPCEPIHYVVNDDGAPRRALEDVHEAAKRIAEVSGFTFRYDGLTDEPVTDVRDAYQPERYGERWAPILIAWGRVPGQSGDSIAVARSTFLVNDDLLPVRVTGAVIIDEDEFLAPGFGYGFTLGEVLLHELAHVLGLAHVDDVTQLMNEEVAPGPAVLGRGDRGGLASVGRRNGCARTPPLPERAAAADAGTFRLQRIEGRVGRFDPCRPIYYTLFWIGAPTDALDDVHRAFAMLARATGVQVVFAGEVDEPPTGNIHGFQGSLGDGVAEVVVGWVARNTGERWPDRWGHAMATLDAVDGGEAFGGGFVMLNEDMRLRAGFGRGRTWGDVLLHQLGHLAGLGDVSDRGEAMDRGPWRGPARWGPGDREGLRLLGRAAGCAE